MKISDYWENEWNKRIVGNKVKFNVGKAEMILNNLKRRNFFKPKQILDIGCGPAFHAIRIQKDEPTYPDRWYGVDLSPVAVKFFKEHGLQGECISIFELETTKKFDVFLLLDSLEHISDRDSLAHKINELAKPEFTIFGNVPLYTDQHGLESGAEEPIDIQILVKFVKMAGCNDMDHFIYGVNGFPYLLFQADRK
jgi:2-polyprenyl-3-methyl-5-hydroxy-6-metoxy-1,4-benzoquinol methylase